MKHSYSSVSNTMLLQERIEIRYRQEMFLTYLFEELYFTIFAYNGIQFIIYKSLPFKDPQIYF